MNGISARIVVAGDVSIDWVSIPVQAREREQNSRPLPLNWQLQGGTRMLARPGGALLLAELVEMATGAKVVTHQLTDIEKIPPEEIIHSIVELNEYPFSKEKKDCDNPFYRVERFRGFAGPASGRIKPLLIIRDDPRAHIVILDDAGNGFRNSRRSWPAALRTRGHSPIVIFKMSRPLFTGDLWQTVLKAHFDRIVLVVSANDLRSEGINISRRLSWERTAKEFLWQMAHNPRLSEAGACAHMVVTFGVDGAIHHTRRGGRVFSRLYYDATVSEDGFRDDCPGDMLGLTSTFVAALAKRIARAGLKATGEGARDGVRCARRLFKQGFGKDPISQNHISKKLFQRANAGERHIAEVPVPNLQPPGSDKGAAVENFRIRELADPGFWCILKQLRGKRLERVARDITLSGAALALKNIPVGHFGKLITVDRAEIESYRSIKNLMLEYVEEVSPKRPLSIAVFGPPGSGKSFGVTQIAESIAPERVETLDEFNVAQFTSTADLISALHKVRDVALSGKIPLVFFDEFDSDFNGTLGWLKYFLAPMQEGKFKGGETMHPVGKAIFVFAGGTSTTYEQFCGEDIKNVVHYNRFEERFKSAKGPDFVSRLRGYVNILGPNPVANEDFFVIRRAMLLRSLLERKTKAKDIFDIDGAANIDDGVLVALLKVPKYKHGVRSMEAIIDMSMLLGKRSFEQAALPPAEQLELHVEAETFSRLMLFRQARERLAKAIHEKYRRDQAKTKDPHDRAMKPWNKLDEDLKESNREQADDIPEKLRLIKCDFSPVVGREPIRIEFTDEEVELLAEMEHERWVGQKRLEGIRPGKRRTKKTSPYLVEWAHLTDEVKEWDRDTVRGMPDFMAEAGFEIYRLG